MTIKKREEKLLTLDYPNEEVKSSIAGLYLELKINNIIRSVKKNESFNG